MSDINNTRKDFKILGGEKPPIYFDTACMSLRPDRVVAAMDEYYLEYPACGGRSAHKLADRVTKKVKEVRKNVAKFINARSDKEIIFTRNTTESINLLAYSFPFKKGDVVLLSDKEHNSNLVPWLLLRDKIGIEVKIIPGRQDNTFDLEKFKEMVSGVKLVSMVHTSNLDGVTNPAEEIIKLAHEAGVLVLLDCAQSMAHQKIDVQSLDADFIAFSGHKMLGPAGTGILYGKIKLLESLAPFMVGGDTVSDTTYENYQFLEVPEKFEAGLQDYAGIIGLGEAIKYLEKMNFKEIAEHEFKLNTKLTEALSKFSQIKIIGPADPKLRSSVVSFYIPGKEMHQIAVMLDEMAGIAVRSGRHCVHSWFNSRNILNSVRVSFYFYNNEEEVETFIKTLEKILKIL